MKTVTLDTNVIYEYLADQARGRVVEELLKLAESGEVELVVTRGIRKDIARAPLSSRLAELPLLGVREEGKVARLGEWILGVDYLGADSFLGLEEEIHAEWKPGDPALPSQEDFDHLHGHFVRGRDVFLTWDKGILRLAARLARMGIKVMQPEQYLRRVRRTQD